MFFCNVCGKRLMKSEAGNIRPSNPVGYEHKDCSLAAEPPTEAPKPNVVEEKDEPNVVMEKEVVATDEEEEMTKDRKPLWDTKRSGEKFKEESDRMDTVFRKANDRLKKDDLPNKNDESAKD